MTAAVRLVDLHRAFGGGRSLFGRRRPAVQALRGVDLEVAAGETLGIVGESGCGKSTLARLVAGLDRPTRGTIALDGWNARAADARARRAFARTVQYVFQDPMASLNPRRLARHAVEMPLRRLHGLAAQERRVRVDELAAAVGLDAGILDRYPHELSGGQAQRIAIARALAAAPGVLVLDEPVSALDVSVQAQVLNLLGALKRDRGLTYLFISHDLAVVENLADRVAVMYLGRVVELAPAGELYADPRHPYTALLLRSAPIPGRRAIMPASGALDLPDPARPPSGCAFAARCPRADAHCRRVDPTLTPEGVRAVACWNPLPGD